MEYCEIISHVRFAIHLYVLFDDTDPIEDKRRRGSREKLRHPVASVVTIKARKAKYNSAVCGQSRVTRNSFQRIGWHIKATRATRRDDDEQYASNAFASNVSTVKHCEASIKRGVPIRKLRCLPFRANFSPGYLSSDNAHRLLQSITEQKPVRG